MNLSFHLQAGLPGQAETQASVSGDILTVDGVAYDLGSVPDGGDATPAGTHPFVGQISRAGGVIHAAVRWVYDTATAEPAQGATVPSASVTSGTVPDPVQRRS